MDDPSGSTTRTGHNHGLLAMVTFSAATLAALRLGQILGRGDPWQWLAPWSAALGIFMVLFIVGIFVSRRGSALRGYFGLIERGLYVAIIGWLALVGFALVMQP
jgi:hypothetical protein